MQRWRLVLGGIAIVAALGAAVLAGAGWYYSGILDQDALAVRHEPPRFGLRVAGTGPAWVTLEAAPGEDPGDRWRAPGVYGLQWDGGYGQVGRFVNGKETQATQVTREFTPLAGALAVGKTARVDVYAYPGSPRDAFGLPFEEVVIPGPLGTMPAWYIPGRSETWAILVHGHRAERGDMLRQLPAVTSLGLPTLVITYRNDAGVPEDPSGRHRFGATEWQDLEAAVLYGKAHGAGAFVLIGHSMGGGIIATFMGRSPSATLVRAMVLDSPMLDFAATVEFRAADRGAPSLVTAIGKRFATWRFGVDWDELDYLRDLSWVRAPVLVFHGGSDRSVPMATSAELARQSPLVTLVTLPAGQHVASWNLDPQLYEGHVREFLTAVLRSSTAP